MGAMSVAVDKLINYYARRDKKDSSWKDVAAVMSGIRSCLTAWCSSLRATTITGLGRDDQAARVGRLTRGSSPIGAMLSRVM